MVFKTLLHSNKLVIPMYVGYMYSYSVMMLHLRLAIGRLELCYHAMSAALK